MGTPRYMAPEQFHERADARTDVWGLGVTLYELLTLRPAFASRAEIESSEPRSPGEFVSNLPRDLEAICLKALRKDPRQRYATAREFADDLRRWLAQRAGACAALPALYVGCCALVSAQPRLVGRGGADPGSSLGGLRRRNRAGGCAGRRR